MNTINTNTRKQIDYKKVVNIAEDGEITVLDYLFIHNPEFKGATGSKFYPISKSKYKDTVNDDDAVIDSLIDSGMELPDSYKRTGFEGWADAFSTEDRENIFCDTSYRELWDYLREECNLTENEAYIFNCTGGGRCFDKKFKGNKNPELSKLIRQYEA